MKQQERVKAFEAFDKAHKEAKKKARAIIGEVQGITFNLRDKQRKGEVKINVVDVLNIDFYYEAILHAEHNILKMYLLLGGIKKDGTEEEFSFVSQRLNDLMETAKSNFEKIKHIISKFD